MDESSIREYLVTSFPDIGVTDKSGDSYFFTDPEKSFRSPLSLPVTRTTKYRTSAGRAFTD